MGGDIGKLAWKGVTYFAVATDRPTLVAIASHPWTLKLGCMCSMIAMISVASGPVTLKGSAWPEVMFSEAIVVDGIKALLQWKEEV